jgi:hypothetical protein
VTSASLTDAAVLDMVGTTGITEVTATLGVVSAKWANGKRFVAPDISNGFRQKANARLGAAFSLTMEAHPIETINDLASVWDWPIIVTVPYESDDYYWCKEVDGWRCLSVVGSNECGGSIRCTSCTGDTSKKCVKLVLHEEDIEPL